MASNYYYPTSKNAVQKTLSAQLLSTASTGDAITFDDVDGVQNKPGVLVINRVDSNGVATPSSREYISFTGTSGNTVLIETRNVDGSGAARTHAVGSIVEFVADAVWAQRVIDQALVGHEVTGVHKASLTFTTPTLTSPVINTGVSGTAIKDEDNMASDSATALATQQSIKAYVDSNASNFGLYQNAIINGNFDVSQRATTFVAGANNDDVYTLDRWNLISDGNDILDVSQDAVTDLPGSNYAIKLDVETAKRAGIVQFLEAKDAQKFKGKSVSISFAVKSANISAIRATVLSWASTADAVTSDIVGTWAATPTWATNWADNATPADLTVTSSWTTVKVENIAIDESTVNNLALAIWLPNEETIGDIVYISQVQMNEGATALPFQPKSYEDELGACKRYCQVYDSSGAAYQRYATGYWYDTSNAYVLITLPVAMRIVPTGTFTSVGTFAVTSGASNLELTGISVEAASSSATTVNFQCVVAGTGTAGRGTQLCADNTTSSSIILSAEL